MLGASAGAQEPAKQGPGGDVQAAPQKAPSKEDARKLLEQRESEVRELAAGAREISKKIGELAIKGDVVSNKESLDELKKLVAELQGINDRLEKVEGAILEIKGWIEGQNEALPIMSTDILDLKRVKPGAYVQFQYRDSNELGKEQSSWNLRRVRLGDQYEINSRTSAKVSFDVATGSSQIAAELKDAFLNWEIEPTVTKVGTRLTAGQFSLPLGYEIERSSSEREFPERAKYNRTMWDGERVRGAFLTHGTGEHTFVYAGMINSLSIKDKETAFATPDGGAQSAFVGMRYEDTQMAAGIGYLRGDRPAFTAGGGTSPEIDDRNYLYADLSYVGLIDPNLFLRSEAMFGKDRVPSATGGAGKTATTMNGYHVLLGYNLNPRNQLFTRYGTFDPDSDMDGDLFKEYGVGWRYYINPGAMVTLTHEVTEDPALARHRYSVTTLRYQFKF